MTALPRWPARWPRLTGWPVRGLRGWMRGRRWPLAADDAHGFFGAPGDQVVTGHALTNVDDFRAILILPPA